MYNYKASKAYVSPGYLLGEAMQPREIDYRAHVHCADCDTNLSLSLSCNVSVQMPTKDPNLYRPDIGCISVISAYLYYHMIRRTNIGPMLAVVAVGTYAADIGPRSAQPR